MKKGDQKRQETALQILESTRREALHGIETAISHDAKVAWWHCHAGEYEFAFMMGLITRKQFNGLRDEWALTHRELVAE